MAKNEPRVYRQGSAKRILLHILLFIFVIIFVLLFLALLGFRKYIAYTDTGKLYLDIPWLEGYISGPPEYDDLAQYLTFPDDNGDTPSPTPPAEEQADAPQDSDIPLSDSSSDTQEIPDTITSPDNTSSQTE